MTQHQTDRDAPLQVDSIQCCDALSGLRRLPDESIDCVVTSPPYWAMRDYGVNGQLGLEESFKDYLDRLLAVFDEVRRVLKPEGTCWINLGDTYGGSSTHVPYARRHRGKSSIVASDADHAPPQGHRRGRYSKCLLGIPERFMLAMIERGWTLRNKIIWHKPNHMPASVKDRLTNSWEYVYLFAKSKRYHFALDLIRIPHKSLAKNKNVKDAKRMSPHIDGRRMPPKSAANGAFHPNGKNPADHWSIPPDTRPRPRKGRSASARPSGSGWFGSVPGGAARILREADRRWLHPDGRNPGDSWSIPINSTQNGKWSRGHFAVFPEKLIERPILAGCPKGGIVLDPFIGSGTTAVVAKRLGRHFIGFELNPDYVELAYRRVAGQK